MVPGELIVGDGPVRVVPDRPLRRLAVANTGDRPVQVGSHYHLAEVNPALQLDRAVAWGHRLAIPAGTSVRFEPGIERTVDIVPYGGARVAAGFRGACGGALDTSRDERAGGAADPPAGSGGTA